MGLLQPLKRKKTPTHFDTEATPNHHLRIPENPNSLSSSLHSSSPTAMASTVEPTVLKREEEEEDDSKPSAEDEDTGAQIAPIIKLQEVAVTTGEEDEDVLLDLKSKLYRFDKEGNQWKERGVGTVKLLKHKETGKVRLVMRQNKTLKICANHLVLSTMTVQEHQGNEKSCVWHAADFSDGEVKEETFCIRFASVESKGSHEDKGGPFLCSVLLLSFIEKTSVYCKSFKDKIEEIAESQSKDSEDSEEGKAAAKLIEKLNVEEKEAKEEIPEDKAEGKKDDTEKQE
ncbi:hypothetical protein RD792_013200 [Penstemon davidsonii]|uniref:RanBD1 domain-containing protein n=1 Tax=Penstemon davidsonii TaxID=160366 RepID=A0ABR0CSV8_9LAMI|nr:hypothetical protein RD792_013200 [Penstemon davidsonii]